MPNPIYDKLKAANFSDEEIARDFPDAMPEPSLASIGGMGAFARGALSAANTTVASTLEKFAKFPTHGKENVVSKQFAGAEQYGREALRPSDKRYSKLFETSENIGRIPAEIMKSSVGGAVPQAALAMGEAIGSSSEQSDAHAVAELAKTMGWNRIASAMDAAAGTPEGRALTSVVFSALPESAIGLAKKTKASAPAAAKKLAEDIAARVNSKTNVEPFINAKGKTKYRPVKLQPDRVPYKAPPNPELQGPWQASQIPERIPQGPWEASQLPERDPRKLLTARTSGKPLARGVEAEVPIGSSTGPAIPLGGKKIPTSVVRYEPPLDAATKANVLASSSKTANDVAAERAMWNSMSEKDIKDWMLSRIGPEMSEQEKLAFMARRIGGEPLSDVERANLRGVRAPKISAGRRRSGAVDAQLLSTLTGGAGGALYGGGTAEEGESPLTRALLYGAGGAAAGAGIPRFFRRGASPSLAPNAGQLEQSIADVVREGRPQTALGEVAAEFPKNREPMLRRLGLPEDLPADIKDQLMTRIGQIESTIKRPVTEADVHAEAAKFLKDKSVEQVSNLNTKRMSGAEGLAVASLINEHVTSLAEKVQKLKSTIDVGERATLSAEIGDLQARATKLISTLMKGNTAQGRDLQAAGIVAKAINDPAVWILQGTRIKNGASLSANEMETITRLSNEKKTEELLQYLAGLRKSSIPEQIVGMRNAGLLTAIPGRLRDLVSTSANYVSDVILRAPASALDVIASRYAEHKLGGFGSQYRSIAAPSRVELESAVKQGLPDGMRDAMRSVGFDAAKDGGFAGWVDFIRRAEIDPEMAKQLDVPHLVNITMFGESAVGQKANAIADTYQKLIMRFSGVTDKLVKGAAYRGAISEEAKLTAIREGLKGDDLARRTTQLMTAPTDDMIANAIATAERITFTNDGTLSAMISSAIGAASSRGDKAKIGNFVRVGTKFVEPFRRTPANILTTALEYAPGTGALISGKRALDWTAALADMALSTNAGRANASKELLKQQRKMVQSMTRAGTGMGLVGAGVALYEAGLLTPEAPESQSEQEQWRTEGKQPESLLINGQWIPIARITPYGSILTLGATLKNSAQKSLMDAGLAVTRSVLNQPMVTGPRDLAVALTGRKEADSENFVQSQLGSFIPTVVGQIARSEGVQRLPQSVGQSLTSRIPGLQSTAPQRLDIFGEPVEKAKGLLNVAVNPLPTTADVRTKDPLVKELSDVGAVIGAVSKHSGESMDIYQYRQKGAGQWLREDLTALLKDPAYIAASKADKKLMIETQAQKTRSAFDREFNDTFAPPP
jgi:hypothetical protein